MDVDDLPILGEPLSIELANTRYCYNDDGQSKVLDFLGDVDLVRLWFRNASAAEVLVLPTKLDESVLQQLRALRDVIANSLGVVARGGTPLPEDIDQLNLAADRAAFRRLLVWSEDGCGSISEVGEGAEVDVLLATLARSAMGFLASPDVAKLRICGAPDCPMLFQKNHHRRRWCENSCGHRTRQAAYYLRKKSGVAEASTRA